MIRSLIIIFLAACILTIFPTVGSSDQPYRITFLITDGNTKILSEGISRFNMAFPQLASKLKITVMIEQDLEDAPVADRFADQDVIFLNHLGYKVMLDMEKALKEARQRGAKVIGVGGYEIFKQKGYFNVDEGEYPELFTYWDYSGAENIRRLIVYILNHFGGFDDLKVETPVVQPMDGIFHPDAPDSKVFDSFSAYKSWYESSGHKKDAPWVGVTSYNILKTGDAKIPESMIRGLEKKGLNVVCAIGYPADILIKKYMLVDGLNLDLMISLMFSHPNEETNELFARLNVPVIRAISLYNEIEEWKKDPQGVDAAQLASQIFLPEMSGLIEPIVVGGKRIYTDEKTGIKVTERIPVEERIEKLSSRAVSWLRLKGLPVNEKRVAVLYYNHHTGKQNIGASYLDLFASLQLLLDSLKKAGYDLGDDVPLNKEILQEVIIMQGRNISTKAPGELKKMLDTGKIELLPIEQYKEWYSKLPEEFRKGVEGKWGNVDNSTLMTWEDKEKNQKYIVIPGLTFGNLFVGPQPTRGWLEESDHLYHDVTLPPHHQYLAFYLWLKHGFKVDAVVHFGKHGTLEWTPGKQVGLTENCAPDVLMQDIPDIYPYLIDDVGEGLQAKRRGYGVIIDHMIPAIKISGLYEEYARLNELIPLYEQAKEQTPAVAEKYQEEILTMADELGIAKDIGIKLEKDKFDALLDKLHDYLAEIRAESMPYGLHVLGLSLEGESLVSMVNAMLGVESDIPSLKEIVAGIMDMDWKKMKKRPGKFIKEMEKVDTVCDVLLTKIILENIPLEKAMNTSLGTMYSKASTENKGNLKTLLSRGIGYAKDLGKCDEEIKSILNGLNAGYIPPGPGNDPIRDPGVLPSGRNFYGFNPEKVPTRASWEVGKKLADDLIQDYLDKKGRYPHKTALVLWATETLRHHGVMESKALYLMGARPIWDGRGSIKGVELIPEQELKRPRIDILVSASGLYRDVFPLQIGLIDDAVQLVINEKQGKYDNFVRLHSLESEELFIKKGYSKEDAEQLSRFRIFGSPNQGYGTGLDQAIPASGTWEKEDKLADLYMNRMNYAYGRNAWGKKSEDAFRQALSGTDLVVHSRSTNLFGVLDNDDFYQYMGGLAMAVRNVSGETPELYVSDAKNPADPKMVNFAKFMGLETRARYFNPKWITGMKENGYSGAREMAKFVEHLWGWQVTTPDEVSKEMWEQAQQIYVEDKYGMELKEFFEKNSPHAFQSITARLMEVERKGYQKFEKEMLQKAAAEYIKSVADKGMACCEHTCNNIALNQFAANIMSVPGMVSPSEMIKFQQQVKLTTGLDIKNPEWVEKAENEIKNDGMAPGEKADDPGKSKTQEVKGYEMKEKKEEESTEISSSGASLAAVLIVLAIVAIIGRGIWKGIKKD
ncbi:MAG: cobaltochelatase subunit CobN [Deltaproteobacteria bacterium]|nr:cobaltochelatase subunit CobN [Deltaproteobacteria bacterium]